MLKMSYSLIHKSRVCNRAGAISNIFMKINEFSSTAIPESSLLKPSLNLQNAETPSNEPIVDKSMGDLKTKSKIVAAAFAALNEKDSKLVSEIATPRTDSKIVDATTVEQLLSIPEGEGVSRRLALKVVSVLAEWTATKKIKLADFENDVRFIRLCRVLTKGNGRQERYITSKSEDLSTVLSVTADDEAARLVETITLPQMIKVMTTLAIKKRRSTLLLRTLAYNISGSPEKLNIKLCADLLYSMSSLNFLDENLLSRVAVDICTEHEVMPESKTSAAIGSILTSLGLLKYKNPAVLDSLIHWITKNYGTCRSQDIFRLFITLAILNYVPEDAERCFKAVSPMLTELEAGKPSVWLDHIWSKVLLNMATPDEVSHVLSENFLTSILNSDSELYIMSAKLKILNINGAAQHLIEGYKGNLLPSSLLGNVPIQRRKEKIEMCDSIANSLKNLIQSDKFIKTNIDTGYGFCIDAECVIDEKCRAKELNVDKTEGTRIAIMSLDYHDMTKGRMEPTGINVFARTLLEAAGYKVLIVPYTEFNPKDKIITRVKYLEKSLKELVKA